MDVSRLQLWLVRDEDGKLWLHKFRPAAMGGHWWTLMKPILFWMPGLSAEDPCPELTFDDGPRLISRIEF